MARRPELDNSFVARGDMLDATQLGLLLDDLQLGAGTATSPERFRQALALLARPARRLRNPIGIPHGNGVPVICA